ncbi:hypothetical protein F9278_28205 [Streptomyces phaeolivaceus]|uniref:Tetratricopeptide repeat protein n=1 Tax=Streptomyces phaeolivaceus TaxID=2653200 RepID=A0A5P8K8M3_9ACTN|nr:hypothetical protein [Streptomyces phaeolivaceus]QFQ99394.1 hypothetical protein F9278_28205 [Streptomyces phaeolivaceus]
MNDVAGRLRTLARARARSARRAWAEAAPLWDEVVTANPVNGEHWDRLAEARFGLGEYRAALPAYERVLALGVSPDRETSRPGAVPYQIARCRARLGDVDGALDAVRAALAAGFRDVQRVRGDEHLAALRGDPRLAELLGGPAAGGDGREEGWRGDLALLAREAKRRRPPARTREAEERFDAQVALLGERIPQLTDAQVFVELWRLLRPLEDGHARVLVPDPDHELNHLLPVQFYLFEEGLFVTAAAPGYEALLGAQVRAFDGTATEEVMTVVEPVITRDNDYGPRHNLPTWLRRTAVLHALGVTGDSAKATLTVTAADGERREVSLPAAAGAVDGFPAPPGWRFLPDTLSEPVPLSLRNAGCCYWFEYLPADRLVYLQLNNIMNDPDEPLADFTDRLFSFIEEYPVDRLVIDLRWNGGGNTFLATGLLRRLLSCAKLGRRGSLFLVVGRRTFSAAQNTATLIERYTDAVVVGEPTGSRPNFTGETAPFLLPHSRLRVNISDLYWQSSFPMDSRTAIAPDLYVPPTFDDFRSNRDPVMEAIRSCTEHLPGW